MQDISYSGQSNCGDRIGEARQSQLARANGVRVAKIVSPAGPTGNGDRYGCEVDRGRSARAFVTMSFTSFMSVGTW